MWARPAAARIRWKAVIALSQKVLETFRPWVILSPMALPRPEPVELHARAMDNLRYIRRTIERAGSFTAVPGLGGVLMGSTALAAAWIAGPRTADVRWLTVWLAEAVVALLIGILGAAVKSRRAGMPLLSGPGRKFVAGFAPSMIAGVVLSAVLFRARVGRVTAGRVASALRSGRAFGRLGLGARGADDGRLLHGGRHGGAALARGAGRCFSGRWVWRLAHSLRNGDCDSLWRLNRMRRGATRDKKQLALPLAMPSAGGAQKLDRLIHERLRLGILSALSVNETLTFNDLKKTARYHRWQPQRARAQAGGSRVRIAARSRSRGACRKPNTS